MDASTIDIRDDHTLVGMDDKSVLSLNGCRVGSEILGLVPDPATFRESLRCIKVSTPNHDAPSMLSSNFAPFHRFLTSTRMRSWGVLQFWARRRGIYGNILGFPGGVAFAILVAKICQLYPRGRPSTIVTRCIRHCLFVYDRAFHTAFLLYFRHPSRQRQHLPLRCLPTVPRPPPQTTS